MGKRHEVIIDKVEIQMANNVEERQIKSCLMMISKNARLKNYNPQCWPEHGNVKGYCN